ncbi:MAG: putative peptidoglycan glycosyltransferase FtsW [Patescibacteria group bacterium]
MRARIDKTFLTLTLILTGAGFFIFISASLGLLARETGHFSSIAVNQGVSLVIGLVLLYFTSRIPYTFWHRYSFFIFLLSIIATLLVFTPWFGFEHAGARRWLSIGTLSFQPAEFMKFGFVLYLAAWYSMVKTKVSTWACGLGPVVTLLVVCAAILAFQPDYGTVIVIAVTGGVMYIVAGGSWKHIGTLVLTGVLGLVILGTSVPYIKERVVTFLNPQHDQQGSSYQLKQSLIAIGSGEIFGKGFGQSVQKFNFLPEPVGDSIFAVFAEEWGFVGSTVLILLFLAFLLRGYRIGIHAPTTFARLVVVGFATMIVGQSFMNIGSMLGVVPLTGDPLVFVSQGGSSLVIALAATGIILNISKHVRLGAPA